MDIYNLRMIYREASKEEILEAYHTMDIEETDSSSGDRTLLHTAAALGDADAVKLLLDKGRSANWVQQY